jgi:hypothetical protein
MKLVYIKWRRCGSYEKRGARKAAIRNAHRTVRQQCRKQLGVMRKDFSLMEYEIVPFEWYESAPDSTPIQYFDDFMHPLVSLGYFD